MFDSLKQEITRRRALWITPLAFTGVIAILLRRGNRSETTVSASDQGADVTIVQFNDAGTKLERASVKKVVHSIAGWRKQLTLEQFYVTRQEGTDMAFTGTYYQIHDPGLFRCVCCGNALFSSDAKFDSGTGWPSFWAPIAEENIRTRSDKSLLMERVEVECKRCDAHLGHVFEDGPPPTNLRYCINESALLFIKRA